MKDTSLVDPGVKVQSFETTYRAVTAACQQQPPSASAGKVVSQVLRYNIIHGGAPLPNNHRFETFIGKPVHRKRPPAAVGEQDM